MDYHAKVMEIMEKVLDIKLANVPAGEITPAQIPQWDSVAHLNLAAALEDEFDIRFTAQEIAGMLGGCRPVVECLRRKVTEG